MEKETAPVVKAEELKEPAVAEEVKPSIPDISFSIVKGAKEALSKTEDVVEKAKSKTAETIETLKDVGEKVAGTVGKSLRVKKIDI